MYVQETVTIHMFDQLEVQNWNDLLSPPADIFKMCYSCTMTRVRIATATGALTTIPRTITCLTGYHVPFNWSFTLLYMSPELFVIDKCHCTKRKPFI